MIVHEENGLLTQDISVNALVETLEKFLSDSKIFDRNKIRQKALIIKSRQRATSNCIIIFWKRVMNTNHI